MSFWNLSQKDALEDLDTFNFQATIIVKYSQKSLSF